MKTLDQYSGMPQMEAAFQGWFSQITLQVIKQDIVDGLVDDSPKSTTFQGTIQPLSPEELKLKPEGERSWRWLMIHCLAGDLNLTTADKIIFNGVRFKIMKMNDYSLNNYVEYHAVEDFSNE